MECPKCHGSTWVVYKYDRVTDNAITRRRECHSCKYRFTTAEHWEDAPRVGSGWGKSSWESERDEACALYP